MTLHFRAEYISVITLARTHQMVCYKRKHAALITRIDDLTERRNWADICETSNEIIRLETAMRRMDNFASRNLEMDVDKPFFTFLSDFNASFQRELYRSLEAYEGSLKEEQAIAIRRYLSTEHDSRDAIGETIGFLGPILALGEMLGYLGATT